MRPSAWHPPVEASSLEQTIITRIKRAKLFVFLRHHRHEIFDDAFQEELAALYTSSLRGQPPIAPAQLTLAIIVQAYTGVSDDEVIEATLMDRRWQLVLDCLDTDQAPFSKGTLVAFRKRFIAAQMDRRLIERTIEVASQSQDFGPRALRAALDSSPLWGARRVEDTYNLSAPRQRQIRSAACAVGAVGMPPCTPGLSLSDWLKSRKRKGSAACQEQGDVGGNGQSSELSVQGVYGQGETS